MRNEKELEGITSLGNQGTTYDFKEPNVGILETFINKHQGKDYLVDFKCPEFSSLCPKTGQPDFATIFIRYIPNVRMVESKSLKLYLFSYRNHGDFHEDCVNKICNDLVEAMEPRWCRVVGDFMPRGGISITAVADYTEKGFDVPEKYSKLPADLHTRHQ